MTVPVLWSFLEKYPEHEIWFLSRPFATDLIAPLPRVHFISVELKGRHKGFLGLLRLFTVLKKHGPWDAVVDLHSVLRTHVLTTLFSLSGTRVSKIVKGRSEKKQLTRKENKVFRPLPTTTERYRKTFEEAGFPFEPVPFPGKDLYGRISSEPKSQESLPWGDLGAPSFLIGVAPFAKHHWKMWPETKMLELLKMLDKEGRNVILFGGPGQEQEKLEQWTSDFNNVRTFAGRLTMAQELALMSRLEVMVSMDSANMHLASLAGTRVVSIWGATHPYAGFYGFGQSVHNAVQVDLDCRPCSVFGNKACHRGDFACMERVVPEMVVDRILNK